jgi:hypothetical protein
MADPATPTPTPSPARIAINAGAIHIEYEGPTEYLRELPVLIEELRKAVGGSTPTSPASQ